MEKHTFSKGTTVRPIVRNVPNPPPAKKTVLVVGQPRGGTSSVAAVLDAIGVPMGEPSELRNGGSFESFTFVHGTAEQRLAEVARLNAKYPIWGWKAPFGVNALDSRPKTVRNLHCVFVIRDIVALAQAYLFHNKTNLDDSFAFATRENHRILNRARNTDLPSLLVSYERIKSDPGRFVEMLAAFLSIPVSDKQKQEAIARVSSTGGYVVMPQDYGYPAAPAPHTTPEKWKK